MARTTPPIISDRAYFDGEDHPRCPATPSAAEVRPDMRMAGGTWGCALPEGHEDFEQARFHPHSWVQVRGAT